MSNELKLSVFLKDEEGDAVYAPDYLEGEWSNILPPMPEETMCYIDYGELTLFLFKLGAWVTKHPEWKNGLVVRVPRHA